MVAMLFTPTVQLVNSGDILRLVYIKQSDMSSTIYSRRKQYCYHQNAKYRTVLYCSPFSYRSFNFAIAKVVALNHFASIFLLVLQIGSWLLFCIASHIVVALLRSLRRQRKVTVIFSLSPLRTRKSVNYRYRDSWQHKYFVFWWQQ